MNNLPRGVRLNNPGNIEKRDPWQGLSAVQPDARFCSFESPEWGIRAIARVLISYQDKHSIRTVRGIISRWAPDVENDTGSYISHVASKVGVGADMRIDVTDYRICLPLVEAIILHENGRNPAAADGKWYSLTVVNRGLELAGISAPVYAESEALDEERPLPATRTVKGGQVAAAGGVLSIGSAAVEQFGPAFPLLQTVVEYAPWVVGVIVIIGVGVVVAARLDDRKKGLR